jgi:hypothetical protein
MRSLKLRNRSHGRDGWTGRRVHRVANPGRLLFFLGKRLSTMSLPRRDAARVSSRPTGSLRHAPHRCHPARSAFTASTIRVVRPLRRRRYKTTPEKRGNRPPSTGSYLQSRKSCSIHSEEQKRRLLHNAVTRAKERCVVLVQAPAHGPSPIRTRAWLTAQTPLSIATAIPQSFSVEIECKA